MKRFIYLALMAAACTAEVPTQEQTSVLKPIQLQADTTTLFLRDLFPTGPLPDTLLPPSGLAWAWGTDTRMPHDTVVYVWGELTEPRSILGFQQGNQVTEVVLFQSRSTKVVFSLAGESNDEVQIRGSFNGWNELANPMAFESGVWSATFNLEPGSYEYLFKVNGREQTDPACRDSVSNGMGRFNSLVVVAADTTPVVALQPHFDASKGLFQEDLLEDQAWLAMHNNRVLAKGLGPYQIPMAAEKGFSHISV